MRKTPKDEQRSISIPNRARHTSYPHRIRSTSAPHTLRTIHQPHVARTSPHLPILSRRLRSPQSSLSSSIEVLPSQGPSQAPPCTPAVVVAADPSVPPPSSDDSPSIRELYHGKTVDTRNTKPTTEK